MGLPCGEIRSMAAQASLESSLALGYLDMQHKASEEEKADELPGELRLNLVDQINRSSVIDQEIPNEYDLRLKSDALDMLIVNGNHYEAKAQVVVISDAKRIKEKYFHRISNPVAIVLDGDVEIPAEMLEAVPALDGVRTYALEEFSLAEIIAGHYNQPPVYGLVLTGGVSTRMKRDKALIDFHGKPQAQHLAELLKSSCEQVMISARDDQDRSAWGYDVIDDQFRDMGPLGGILSAMKAHPDAAWLVVATDLPRLGQATIDELLKKRNASKYATAFVSGHDGFPEPLIAIWEPRMYARALQFLSLGYTCPRKALINSDIELLENSLAEEHVNVNTPEELEKIKSI